MTVPEPAIGQAGGYSCTVAIDNVVVYRASKSVSYFNGQPIVTGPPTYRSPVSLASGQSYKIVATQSTSYAAGASLKWGTSANSTVLVPSSALTPAVTSTPGINIIGINGRSTGPTSVSFWWNRVNPTAVYRMYRGTTPGGEEYDSPLPGEPFHDGLGYVAFHDNGLAPNTDYYYTAKVVYQNPVTELTIESNPTVERLGRGSATGAQFHLWVDSNRDGQFNSSDDGSKGSYSPSSGAMVLPNLDRNSTAVPSGTPQNDKIVFNYNAAPSFPAGSATVVDGDDAQDLLRFDVEALPSTPYTGSGLTSVKLTFGSLTEAKMVRIYGPVPTGTLPTSATPLAFDGPAATSASFSLPTSYVVRRIERCSYYLEQLYYPGQKVYLTSGSAVAPDRITLTLSGYDSYPPTLNDVAVIGSAPLRAIPDTAAALEVFVLPSQSVKGDIDASRTNRFLVSQLQSLGPTTILTGANALAAFTQDEVEIGWSPTPSGSKRQVTVRFPFSGSSGVGFPAWSQMYLLGKGLSTLGTGSAYDGHTVGGNFNGLPFGAKSAMFRGDNVPAAEKDLFKSDRPVIETIARWFRIGHIDEWINVLPNGDIAIADPRKLRPILQQIVDAGKGYSSTFFDCKLYNPSEAVLRSTVFATEVGPSNDLGGDGTTTVPLDDHALRVYTNADIPSSAIYKYVRIIKPSQPHNTSVGRIKRVGKRFVDIEYLWYVTGDFIKPRNGGGWAFYAPSYTAFSRGVGIFNSTFLNIATQLTGANAVPVVKRGALGDKLVFVEDTLIYPSPQEQPAIPDFPAFFTAQELYEDLEFWTLADRIGSEIDIAVAAIYQSFINAGVQPSEIETFLSHRVKRIPVAFGAAAINGFTLKSELEAGARALIPNPINWQLAFGKTLIPEQFGPRDAQGNDLIQSAIAAEVGSSAVFINTWCGHVNDGGVHCFTSVRRILP